MVSYLCGNASIPLDSNLDIETLVYCIDHT